MIGGGVTWARVIAMAALCVGAIVASPDPALALNSNKYCSAGSDATKTADTMPGSLLSINDVALWTGSTHTASNCYGDFDPGNSSPSNETAALNEIFGGISRGGDFTYLDKTGGDRNPSGLNGIKFEVQTFGGSNGALGLWTIVWWAEEPLSAPIMIDLAVLLVGGNHSAAYLLSGLLLPYSPGLGIGTFDIQFVNGSGLQSFGFGCHYSHKAHTTQDKNGKHDNDKDKDCDKLNQPSISHLLVTGRVVTTTTQIPEPSTVAMFGAGLLGVWMFGRRRPA